MRAKTLGLKLDRNEKKGFKTIICKLSTIVCMLHHIVVACFWLMMPSLILVMTLAGEPRLVNAIKRVLLPPGQGTEGQRRR